MWRSATSTCPRPRNGRARCRSAPRRSWSAITNRYLGFSTAAEPTYSISELNLEVREILAEAFRACWVRGEVHRLRLSQNGHCYFEMVEKGAGDQVLGKIDAVIWRTDFLRIQRQLAEGGQRLAEGQEIRCFGQLDFYPPTGRIQLVVREVDPLFTLGNLERRRRETLLALQSAGLLEANGRHELPLLPLRIGLVTSKDSAAYHDFMTGLESSGFGFQVLLVHAAVQGLSAERELVSALQLLARITVQEQPLDAVVVVRGGGARTDLAVFDSKALALAVARCPLPLLCGLGHETDRSIVDVVAHTSLKTPTMVAEFLVQRLLAAEARALDLRRAIAQAAAGQLARGDRELRRFDRLPHLALQRLAAARRAVLDGGRALARHSRQDLRDGDRRLEELRRRLQVAAGRAVERQRPRAETLAQRVAHAAVAQLRPRAAWLDGVARLCQQAAPERLLDRGYSVTRDARGQLVRSPDQVRSGEILTTQVAAGVISSRVEGA